MLSNKHFTGYNRELFDKEWFSESCPQIQKAFDAFRPRSAFISPNNKIERVNTLALDEFEQPNIVFTKNRFNENTTGIADFDEVFASNSKYSIIREKLNFIEDYVAQHINGCKTTFISFSTTMTGATLGVKHLHPLMNGDRCNVWSFCLPLFINPEEKQKPGFWYTQQYELYPKRWYIDYDRIKQADFNYAHIEIPTDGKIFSIKFDGAKMPHYADYTDHLYAWFVFDGCDYKYPVDPEWIQTALL